jgi:phage-related baseplate assembly protein
VIQSAAAWRCQVTAALVLMAGADAEVVEPAGQLRGADPPSGLASGEQPDHE